MTNLEGDDTYDMKVVDPWGSILVELFVGANATIYGSEKQDSREDKGDKLKFERKEHPRTSHLLRSLRRIGTFT